MKQNRTGAIVPLVAVLLPVALLLIAIIINVAYIELSRTELRIATDSAVRAGGRELALTGDVEMAKKAARDAAKRNLVAGSPLLLGDDDFEVGVSSRQASNARYSFSTGTGQKPNSIQILGRRRNGGASGAISYFMPNVLGRTGFELEQEAISTQVELDLAIIVDRSGSMAYSDDEDAEEMSAAGLYPSAAANGWVFGDKVPDNSRWLDLVAATDLLLARLESTPQSELVSLTTYGDSATTDVGLTHNYGEIIGGLDGISQMFDGGGTNIGGGIDRGVASLNESASRPLAVKVAVLLTDGRHNTGTMPIPAARDNVKIYTVTFSQEAHQGDMSRVAALSGGKHFHADSRQTLIDAFEEIGKSLPTLITK